MNISWLELTLLILASFRITRLFVFDRITEFIRNLFLKEVEEKDEADNSEIYIVPREGKIRGFIGVQVCGSQFFLLYYIIYFQVFVNHLYLYSQLLEQHLY